MNSTVTEAPIEVKLISRNDLTLSARSRVREVVAIFRDDSRQTLGWVISDSQEVAHRLHTKVGHYGWAADGYAFGGCTSLRWAVDKITFAGGYRRGQQGWEINPNAAANRQ